MKRIKDPGFYPAFEWARVRSAGTVDIFARKRMEILHSFCKFSRKSPTHLVAIAKSRTGRRSIVRMIDKWAESLRVDENDKVGQISYVRDFFDFNKAPLPRDPVWGARLASLISYFPIPLKVTIIPKRIVCQATHRRLLPTSRRTRTRHQVLSSP